MQIPYYHVDAFTDGLFGGNPAGICLLHKWPSSDRLLLDIARENKHSETAFLVRTQRGFKIRWFTPAKEVFLCGHATLAAAFILFTKRGHPRDQRIEFETEKEGVVAAVWNRKTRTVTLDFPAWRGTRVPRAKIPKALTKGLRASPLEVLWSRDYLAVFAKAEEVVNLEPDFEQLGEVENCLGIIATAKGEAGSDVDFVLRFFEPRAGVPEDPVTGSAHCTLIPYWADRLGKSQLIAQQRSLRGGTIYCELRDHGRVGIGGQAVLYNSGKLLLRAADF